MLEHYISLGGLLVKGYEFKGENVCTQDVNIPYKGPFVVNLNGYSKENPNGKTIIVSCHYIFGCDGKHSIVRDWLKIKFKSIGSS